ncbi:MAG: nucleotidyltransferase [Bacteroidetes bacterium]|nr:MAG: nucleotidyltransferase [Bacteroidota bacterium]
MARTIAEIQTEIIGYIQGDANLSEASSTSATALWRLLAYVMARAIATFENLHDRFRTEVTNTVATLKPHTARWYRQKSLDFQLGYSLVEGGDYYDNTGENPEIVELSKIVAAAAVTEAEGELTVKVTKIEVAEFTPLIISEYNAFLDYMQQIKDAGVVLNVLSFPADRLELEVDVYYDPLILDDTGARLDGTDTNPVEDAILDWLKDQPFNGLFVKAHLVDAMQAVEGVFVPEVRRCLAARHDNDTAVNIDIEYQPASGFLRFYPEAPLVLNYIPHA